MNTEQYALLRRLEDDYWWHRSLREMARKHLCDAKTILDAGCGTGALLGELRGVQAIGLDHSPLALQYSRERALARLVRGSVEALPFASGTFDAVVTLDVLYHRAVTDDLSALREFHRVLKPGGVLILQVPAFRWLSGAHDAAVFGARRYTAGQVEQLLGRAGLKRVFLTYRNLFALPAAIVTRKLLPNLFASEFGPLPALLNSLLFRLSSLENRCLSLSRLPFGLSVFSVARKPA